MSEENWFQRAKPFVSFLKLRASFGLVGNDKISGSRFMYTADPYSVNLNDLTNRYASSSGSGGYGYFSERTV